MALMNAIIVILDGWLLCDYRTTGFLNINAAAVEALELFEMSNNLTASATLFSVMNKCKTLPGQKMLRDWIARPLSDLRQIEERQDVVSALVEADDVRQSIQALLGKLPDLGQLANKLLQYRAKLQDCFRVYQSVRVLRQLEHDLHALVQSSKAYSSQVKELLLEPISHAVYQFDKFIELIRSTVDVEYFEKTGAFRIKPEIDPELLKLSQEMEALDKKCTKAASKAGDRLGVELKLDRNSQYGYFYRVTLKEEKSIRNTRGLLILDTSKGNGVRFRDDNLDALNAEYLDAEKLYASAQEDLESQVVQTCCGYASALSTLSSSLAIVDVIASLATLAAESSRTYTKPKLLPMGTGIFEVKQCRHPVLEVVKDSAFIPNDVKLDEKDRMVILTGANMGGKSTYLRSTALCALMAQMGSWVAATDAKLSIVDAIFTRIGASDQQCRGISTFMAEMVDSATILQTATSDSLVIVDELGRGTSTFDGFGLAWAIACDLLERVRCLCLFATHFHEMAAICDQEGARAMQMAVQAERNQIVLLYEVRPGVAERSFGLHVARMVGFPEDVLKDASNVLERIEQTQTIPDSLRIKLKSAKDLEEIRAILLNA
ncbi:unnamed protein product, partial [Mesorhabditis spiculigera]